MSTTIDCRTARASDLGRVADFWAAMFAEVGLLHEREFAPDWRERFERYFTRRIDENEARIVLAFDDGRLIGTAGALLADGYPAAIHGLRFGYIFGVRVEPDARGRGVATRLTKEAVAYLRTLECRRIRLHASPFGRPIYERLGFEPSNEMILRDGGNRGS